MRALPGSMSAALETNRGAGLLQLSIWKSAKSDLFFIVYTKINSKEINLLMW